MVVSEQQKGVKQGYVPFYYMFDIALDRWENDIAQAMPSDQVLSST